MANRSGGMKKLTVILLVTVYAGCAHAEIWECTDKESGTKRYTNIRSEARGCRALNLGPFSATPPPPRSQRTVNFPSVDDETQRQRDADRRRILDIELAQEQQLLDEARKQLTEQESTRTGDERNYERVTERLEPYQRAVKLHEDNIANLKKEIGNVK